MPALVWDELTDEQAEQLRDAYVAEFPKRLARFLDSLPNELRDRADRTLVSLEFVWQWWVSSHAAPLEIEPEESFLSRELPLWARSAHGLGREIGADNAFAASELAAYVAATILHEHPDAIWTTNNDLSYANARQPLLQRPGHGVPFFPDMNVGVLCTRALRDPPSGGRNPRAGDALRSMVALNVGGSSGPLTSPAVNRDGGSDPGVVVCRPSPAMPRRTYLVLLDEELARSHEQLLPALRRYMQDLSTVASIDDNDERSLIVTLKRFASHHDLQADVEAFVSNHARTSPA
jgi:hypothetical protein